MSEVQEMRKKIIETINELPEEKLIEVDTLIKRVLLEKTIHPSRLFNAKSYFNKARLQEDILKVQHEMRKA